MFVDVCICTCEMCTATLIVPIAKVKSEHRIFAEENREICIEMSLENVIPSANLYNFINFTCSFHILTLVECSILTDWIVVVAISQKIRRFSSIIMYLVYLISGTYFSRLFSHARLMRSIEAWALNQSTACHHRCISLLVNAHCTICLNQCKCYSTSFF